MKTCLAQFEGSEMYLELFHGFYIDMNIVIRNGEMGRKRESGNMGRTVDIFT